MAGGSPNEAWPRTMSLGTVAAETRQAAPPDFEPAVLPVSGRRIFEGELLPLPPEDRLEGGVHRPGSVSGDVDRIPAGLQVVRANLQRGLGAGSAPLRGGPRVVGLRDRAGGVDDAPRRDRMALNYS